MASLPPSASGNWFCAVGKILKVGTTNGAMVPQSGPRAARGFSARLYRVSARIGPGRRLRQSEVGPLSEELDLDEFDKLARLFGLIAVRAGEVIMKVRA